MRGRTGGRLLAAALGLAIGLAWPVPARAASASASLPSPVWSVPVDGPQAVAPDARGAVVTTTLGDVIALNPRGREVWRAKVAPGPAAHAVDGDVVVVAVGGAVLAFARADGAPRWTRALVAEAYQVAAGAGVVVATDLDGGIAAFETADGTPRWAMQAHGPVFHEPVVDAASGAAVLVVPTATGSVLRVLDARTGTTRWEHPVARFTAVPVVTGDEVVVAEGDGAFHAVVLALDLESGARRWASQVRASFESGIVPAVDGRGVLVVDHYGTVTALDRAGRVRWERHLRATVLRTRVVATDRRALLTTASMDVVVLDRASGRVVSRVTARELGGFVVDARAATFRRRGGVVAAVRLGEHTRVDVWPWP